MTLLRVCVIVWTTRSRPGVEVDVVPPEAERFAAAHAGRGEQHPQRVEAIA